MPWCPTTSFPHPLVNINSSNTDKNLTNYLSYGVAELLQWQGLVPLSCFLFPPPHCTLDSSLGGVINRFRVKTLGLYPLSICSGPSVTEIFEVPWTYCFSPSLIPKPKDWKNHIGGFLIHVHEISHQYLVS